MPLQYLEDAARMLKGRVGECRPDRLLFASVIGRLNALIHPGALVVLRFLFVPPAEEAVILGSVFVSFVENRSGICVADHVLFEVPLVLQNVANDSAKKSDVATRANWNEDVGHRAGARESRIDVDDRRTALLGLHHPAESDRVALRHIRSLNDDAVGVLEVLLKRACATSSERGP